MSVMKAIDVLVGEVLNKFCETAREGLTENGQVESPDAVNGIREKHSLITTCPSREAVKQLDILIADIDTDRVTIPMQIDDYDEMHAAFELPGLDFLHPEVGSKRKREVSLYGEGNTSQAPAKRRMGMDEETWKDSR
jgi:hypothetical protein